MARIGGRSGQLSHEEEVELGRRVRSGDDSEATRRLPERERDVLVNRYGLYRDTKATVRELSARLGISERAVRRTQHKAERLLKTLPEPGRRGNSIGEVTV
jgi:DNA-directed RNA polymerase sigma subunit (sigma70/sigma32)